MSGMFPSFVVEYFHPQGAKKAINATLKVNYILFLHEIDSDKFLSNSNLFLSYLPVCWVVHVWGTLHYNSYKCEH